MFKLADLIREQAERIAARLNELAGAELARPYHGSMSRERRLELERALKAGAKAFLQKPVDNTELLAVIRQTLGESVQPEKTTVHDLGSL